jgi:hypothetical protein
MHTPYAETIFTPHPLKIEEESETSPSAVDSKARLDILDELGEEVPDDGEFQYEEDTYSYKARPLLSAIDPESILDALEAVDEAEYDESALTALEYIGLQVRKALWYPQNQEELDRFGVTRPVPLEALTGKQVAGCFGFTIVASECADAAGIDHWIGFANHHSVIIFPSEDQDSIHLIDPLSPELSQDLQHSIATGSTEIEDMKEFGRSVVELNTLNIVHRAKGEDIELLREHDWLTYNRTAQDNPNLTNYIDGDLGRVKNHASKFKLIMSIFNSTEGRQVVQDYLGFKIAYDKQDYVRAASRIQSLRGVYPDVDARNHHTEIKKIVFELAKAEQVALARRVIDSYFESFVILEKDSRFTEAQGDVLRVLGREAQDIDSVLNAIYCYEAVRDKVKFPTSNSEAIKGKLDKTIRLYKDLRLHEKSGS